MLQGHAESTIYPANIELDQQCRRINYEGAN